jgi:quercetin dioxygenase-like cupin family protein
LGDDLEQSFIVRAGEVLHIPANVPHCAFAIEDTIDLDIFSPPREDWLRPGGEDYFKRR